MRIRSITAPNPGAFTLDGTRTYLLGDTAVIDPGPAIDTHLDALLEAAPRLELILITHRHGDHAPGALPLKARTGARIAAPAGVLADADVDVRLTGDESLEVEGKELHVIATPGHTAEHVCFFIPSSGDLFTGDTILGSGTTAIFPPDGDMSAYLESLAVLRNLEPARIHPAHGPTREDAVALIDAYIWHRLERESQIVETLARHPLSIDELRAAIYPDLDARLNPAAEAQLLAHLIRLEQNGHVTQRDGLYTSQ